MRRIHRLRGEEGGVIEQLEVAGAVQPAGRVAELFFDGRRRNCCAGADAHAALVASFRVDRRVAVHACGAAVVQRRRVRSGAEQADAWNGR